MSAIGQRGKWAEGQVQSWMKKRSAAESTFAYLRYPDARAGSFATAPADFLATRKGTHYKVEIKEVTIPVSRQSRRLPEKNFSADKVARMAKWHLAGDACWVVICHLPMKEWRLLPLSALLGSRPPSWDVAGYPAYATVDAVMCELFGKV